MALPQLSPGPVLRGSLLSNFVPDLLSVAVLSKLSFHTTPLKGSVVLASMLEGSCTERQLQSMLEGSCTERQLRL
jgi:hypothetical protein